MLMHETQFDRFISTLELHMNLVRAKWARKSSNLSVRVTLALRFLSFICCYVLASSWAIPTSQYV